MNVHNNTRCAVQGRHLKSDARAVQGLHSVAQRACGHLWLPLGIVLCVLAPPHPARRLAWTRGVMQIIG